MAKKTSRRNHRINRVGLISPCSGNLGNAAILSSMIANIRARIPDAEIIGITLSPEDTESRHGIETFPITGTSHGMYQLSLSAIFAHRRREAVGPPTFIKERLKRIAWLRKLVRTGRAVWLELLHVFRTGQLVRTLDQVIVTGGGALDDFWGGPWGHPWTLFKFAVLCRMFRVPFLFVCVGMCTLERRLSRRFVYWALRLSQYRSYRDYGSQALVKEMFPHCTSAVWPDLAYGYSCPDLLPQRHHASSNMPLVVAVSPIGFCDPRVWPVKDIQRYLRYFNQLTQFLKQAMKAEHRLILFATDGGDADTIKDLLESLSAEPFDTRRVQVLPCPPEQTTEKLLQSICGVDVVIASRLHAVILSHLIALPVVAVSYDRKVDIHMSEIGQSEYCMNIDEFTAEMLAERLAVLRDVRDLESARIKGAVQLYREQIDAQYDLLFGVRHSEPRSDHNTDTLLTQVQL